MTVGAHVDTPAPTIVRFVVGEDDTRALVRLNDRLAANLDLLPPGASAPLVKGRSIDNVPILAITLWGGGHDDHQLRLVAAQLRESIAEVANVSEVTIVGGRPREVAIEVDPARLASAHVDPLQKASPRHSLATVHALAHAPAVHAA